MEMFVNDRDSADKLKAKRSLSSLWIALATVVAIVTTLTGLATPSIASQIVDPMTTSAIASAPISQASDRIFVTALVALGFLTMAAGGIVLTLSSIRDGASRNRRH